MKSLNNKGLSLVELVTAIAILAIAGTMLYYGFVAASDVHAETVKLQMAEDVAQHLAEEFKTNSVDTLKGKYTHTITALPLGDELVFTIPSYIYSVRSANKNAEFSAQVKLTPKQTVADETIGTTTYKQNADETSYFAPASKVGTNSFIVPEVINVYDGKNVVVREELNDYDAIVVNNLLGALVNAIQVKNTQLAAVGSPQVLVDQFIIDFNTKYIPLTSIKDDTATNVTKTTDIEIIEKVLGDTVSYYYVVDQKYEFDFDITLTVTNGATTSNVLLSDFLSGVSIDTQITGATSAYTVDKNGTKYTVKYDSLLADELTGTHNRKGTFAGKIAIKDDKGAEITYKTGSAETKRIPYIYFLYKPFNIYKETTNMSGVYVSNDIVNFEYTGSGNHIMRAFFVPQEMKHGVFIDKDVTMENCNVSALIDFDKELQVFTNSPAIIAGSTSIEETNYLTNSYGKVHTNLYDMTITIKDAEGNEKTITTVKED